MKQLGTVENVHKLQSGLKKVGDESDCVRKLTGFPYKYSNGVRYEST